MEDKKGSIELRDVSYSYQGQGKILDTISLDIPPGELVAIIGPNGSGKSTLIKLLTGLLKPSKGSVTVHGQPSYIPQKINQDVNFPAKVSEILELECCDCSDRDEILKSLDVLKFKDKQFKSLSGGQQQRVFIALSLLSNPDILILDEPTIGVDAKTQENFFKLLKRLNKERNLTILFVTHDTGMVSDYFTTVMCVHNKQLHVEKAENTKKLLKGMYASSAKEMHHHH